MVMHQRRTPFTAQARRACVVRAAADADTPSTSYSAAPVPAADPRFQGLKVFVAGATGGTGKAVVEALRAKGVPVKALVRDAVAAAGKLPAAGEGLQLVEGDGE